MGDTAVDNWSWVKRCEWAADYYNRHVGLTVERKGLKFT